MDNNPLRFIDIKNHNRNMILSFIHESRFNGGLSQSDLVIKTGLKAASLFRIFKDLEDHGFIRAIGAPVELGEKKKGRKPSKYTICEDVCLTIGVEFWATCISLGVFNFNGERIYSDLSNVTKEMDAIGVTDQIYSMINKAITELKIPLYKILGVGLAAPGQVESKSGKILYYHRIANMNGFNIKEELEKKINLKFILCNNCSAIAYYTYKYENFEKADTQFCFLLRSGVNGAFVQNGRIYESADSKTIEVGHIGINFDGPLCSCGQKGCLQAYLFELDKGSDNLTLFSNLSDLVSQKDKEALKIISKAAFYMYQCMKVVEHVLTSKSFKIICLDVAIAEALVSEIKALYQTQSDTLVSKIPSVEAISYDLIMAQKGASDLVLDNFFRTE